MVTLAASERARVKAAIEAAERASAGEIRVLIVQRSVRPHWILGAIVGGAVAALAHLLWRREMWGHPEAIHEAIALGIGLLAGALVAELIGHCPTAAARKRAVRRRAEREFARLGIARTAAHTGVLIMLSRAEREAVLLADRAIDAKVEAGTWDAILARLTAALREERAAEGLAQAVEEAGVALARHFPRVGEKGVNELPDDVEEVR